MIFTYPTLKLGRRLTDQQLWCLGCDVRHPGFPWRELGWRYHPRPDKTRGCGRLTCTLPKGGHLSAWGFGFVATDATHGALWLDRKQFRPGCIDGFSPNRSIWALNDIPAFQAPKTPEERMAAAFLLAELADRMVEHERDVQALLGADYRHRCIDAWTFRRTALPPGDMASSWSNISSAARSLNRVTPDVSLIHT
jgi:hypothetical protein